MSGYYVTQAANVPLIPPIGKPCFKALPMSVRDAVGVNEKQGLTYENETSASLIEKGESVSQLFGYFQVLTKGWAIFPPLVKRECVFVEKPRIIQPESATVKAESIDKALPVVKSEPLTVQSLRKIILRFSQTYRLLEEGQDLLIGATAEEGAVNQYLKQYHQALNSLEGILREDWNKAFWQAKKNASALTPSSPCFTGLQVDQITAHVNFLSTLPLKITQSGQSLCEVPSLKNIRFIHGLTVSLGYLAGSATLFCMGVSVPVIAFIAGIVSALGVMGFFAYEKYKEPEAKEWKERFDTLANFTKQLENLKDSAMIVSFAKQDKKIEIQDVKIEKIAELAEQNQQLAAIVFKLQAEVESMKKGNNEVLEGQSGLSIEESKPSNSSNSEKTAVIQFC